MRRGIVRTLVIAAALGVVTNVGVAVWCAIRLSAGPSLGTSYGIAGGHEIVGELRERPGKAMFTWYPIVDEAFDELWFRQRNAPIYGPLPHWLNEAVLGPVNGYLREQGPYRVEIACGWPWLAFRTGVTVHRWDPTLNIDDLGMNLSPTNKELRALAFKPVWPGAAANSVTFATAWGLALAGPPRMRRWTRARRNACLACGYARGGLGDDAMCPECGAPGGVVNTSGEVGRRLGRCLAYALVLGAISNVVLTAGLVYFARASGTAGALAPWKDGARLFSLSRQEGTAKTIERWHCLAAVETELLLDERIATLATAPLSPWSTLRSESWKQAIAQQPGVLYRVDVAYGWPCRSFRGGCVQGSNGQVTQDVAVNLGQGTATIVRAGVSSVATLIRPTPLTPIPRGLIVNTLVFGGVWFALLAGGMTVRPWMRGRRGLCMDCGYNRRGIAPGAACPECGAMTGIARKGAL